MNAALYFCEPSYLSEYLTRIANATPDEYAKAQALFGDKTDDEDDDDDIYDEDGEEASLSISGILSRDGPSWLARLFGLQGTAYSNILDGIARAEANPNVKRLTLKIDSPGGDVVGVDECWQALRACSKPTLAINTGLMASAAYYIACACDEIRATAPGNETGSVGCYFGGYDDTDMLAEMGVKRIKIIAADSPRKDSDLTSKAGRSELQLRADAQCRGFIDRVAQGRALDYETVRTTFGAGSVMVAEDPDPSKPDAISVGMIDGLSKGATMPGKGPKQPAALAIASISVTEQISGPQGQGENTMKLSELLAANPEAKAEYTAALDAADAAGAKRVQARIDIAKPFLALAVTEGGYTKAEAEQIGKLAASVMVGEDDPAALKSFARLVDLQVESRKTAAAMAETSALRETAPHQADSGVMTQAVAKLGQKRVDQIAAYCKANQRDLNASLQAELEHALERG
jgi:ClpP class serine protease